MSEDTVLELDPEVSAMTKLLAALQPLESEARIRVTRWVIDKLEMHSLVAPMTPSRPMSATQQAATSSVTASPPSERLELGMGSVAAKLGGNSVKDLALAAAIFLTLVHGKSRITRQEIWTAMQQATGHFKKGMKGGNFSRALQTLLKEGHLNEIAKDAYALPASQLDSARARLSK